MYEWLDDARQQRDADMRNLVQLWVVGFDPPIDETIRADLSPLPDLPPDTARLTLRDQFNALSKKHARKTYWQLAESPDSKTGWSLMPDAKGSFNTHAALHMLGGQIAGEGPRLGYRACAYCGKTFVPLRPKGIYCGVNCRTNAYKYREKMKAKARSSVRMRETYTPPPKKGKR